MFLKYVVSEKLTYYDFAYYLCSRQCSEEVFSFQVETDGVYLNKVYDWPMSLTPTMDDQVICVKKLSEKGRKRVGVLGKDTLVWIL